MKSITIGRKDGCDIVIDDEMISRRHAILRIYTFGKIEIVDMSTNGTFVNGVKLRPNVPFPVSRKDVVNFANVHQLDWGLVPDPFKNYKLGVLVIVCFIFLLCAISSFVHREKSQSQIQNVPNNQQSVPTEPIQVQQPSSYSVDSAKSKIKKDKEEDVYLKPIKDLFKPKPKTPKKDKDKEKDENNENENQDGMNMPVGI